MRLLLSPPEEIEELYEKIKSGKGRGDIKWQDFVGFLGWETELDMLDTLEGMLGSKLMALQSIDSRAGGEGIREDVREMIEVYRQGELEKKNLFLPVESDNLYLHPCRSNRDPGEGYRASRPAYD